MPRHHRCYRAACLISILVLLNINNAGADTSNGNLIAVPTGTGETRPHVAFELDNGVKVLVVSDAKAEQGIAALTVEAGRQDDPKQHLSLSHLAEHVLLTGGRLDQCVRRYGGYRNAERRHTTTHFVVATANESFDRVFSCFAANFIRPVIERKTVAREVAAIDAEFQANRASNPRDVNAEALKLTTNPEHPWHYGYAGDARSLEGPPRVIAKALKRFVHRYYDPSRMGLTIGRISSSK